MKYKLVIFDFDGTLADSFPFFMATINLLADRYKFKKIGSNDTDTLRGLGAKAVLQHLGLPLWKTPLVANSFRKMMAKQADQISLFEGIPKMLRSLSDQGASLALVTSNSLQNVNRILTTELFNLIDYAECGTSLFSKQRRLNNILKKASINHHEVIYIGDEIRDMEAASAEEISFGAVCWGYTHAEALIARSPTLVFSQIDEIVEKLA